MLHVEKMSAEEAARMVDIYQHLHEKATCYVDLQGIRVMQELIDAEIRSAENRSETFVSCSADSTQLEKACSELTERQLFEELSGLRLEHYVNNLKMSLILQEIVEHEAAIEALDNPPPPPAREGLCGDTGGLNNRGEYCRARSSKHAHHGGRCYRHAVPM